MPRIRKKTSKRGQTHQREKIKHKAAETRKKRKRDAKKNPQWKSKQPKDPGIPNSFPFKDQILAEIAEERRVAVEEKEKRKADKKAGKAALKAGENAEEDADGEDEPIVVDGVRTLKAGMQATGSGKEAAPAEVEPEVPVLINRELANLRAVIHQADVVLEVLDARDPQSFRSVHLEEFVRAQAKKTVLVLSKVDASPREAVTSWAASLRAQQPTLLFRSASAFMPAASDVSVKGKGKERANDAWGVETVLEYLGQLAQEKKGQSPLVVAVVGLVNVGKSSVVNSLLCKAAVPIYKLSATNEGSTTTAYAQEVILEVGERQIRLIDTPGLSWDATEENTEDLRARDILLRSRGHIERLKDPAAVVADIVARSNREDLMLFYNLPAFTEGDANAFLSAVARSNGLIKKGGVLDLAGASRIVLKDWSTGKYPRYSVPAPSSLSDADGSLAGVYAKDEKVLSLLQTRKEMRKSGGVVKMKLTEVDSRKVALDASWVAADEDNSESEEDEDESAESSAEEDDDEEEEVDELDGEDGDESSEDDEEPEDLPAPVPVGKRKRANAKIIPDARPSKKVAFAAEPKGTKQARSAAGAKGASIAAAKRTPKTKPLKKPDTRVRLSGAVPAAANAGRSKKAVMATAGEEAYDFGKFF